MKISQWRPRTFVLIAVAGLLVSLVRPFLAGFNIGESGVSKVLLFGVAGVGFLMLYLGIRFAVIRRREIAEEQAATVGENDESSRSDNS